MQRLSFVSIVSLGAVALLLGPGCRPKYYNDNPDVAAEYREDNKYLDDMVTARTSREYEEQGAAIKPATLSAIEHTITHVYEKDFERCLEAEMEAQKTRFLRSAFTLEFHIDTDGSASKAKFLNIQVRKQSPKGDDLGQIPSEGMQACITKAVDTWEFDPAPEAAYVHTYTGQVGEAF